MTVGSHNSRSRSRVGSRHSRASDQPDLFQQLEEPTPPPHLDLDIGPELLGALHTALRQARTRGLSRERVVDAMNRYLPDLARPITLRQLNAWTAASKEFSEFPARYVAAFCVATECDLPMRVLASAIGADLYDAREADARRLGESLIEAARLRREQSDIRRRLGG
ncbi:hypothetical protein [Algiphilus sp.]|uniref:hypothetical protein n=1 Tax=Algiphilus sp. TaxID=1872431 RepID=UPI0025BDCE00|nr:hypothetical protein [Algiphilus sp.]MCK5772034.1 hypothetical protein [Algiphilus sp.]